MQSNRLSNIQNILNQNNLDALFITNFYNILYFTGFRTLVPHEREAYALVTRENVYVFSDGRYEKHTPFIPSREGNVGCVIEFRLLTPEKGLMKHLQEIIVEEKIVKLGFEKDDLKWSEYDTFQKTLEVELIFQDRVGVKIRAVKETQEIKKIQRACEVGDKCLSDISKTLHEGLSEKEIAWNIEKWIRDKGYEIAFGPIVAVDANSAVPHYDTKNGTGVIKSNSIILIDMGVTFEGYNSDITRMFFIGEQPDEVMNAYQTLLSAQIKTIQNISNIKKLSKLDSFCRKEVARYPSKKLRASTLRDLSYPHSTGHGVGLEVHEYPKISGASEDTIQAGNVLTIEPGIYIPGKWGMRIEDTALITSDNKAKVLTAYPKSMQIL